MNFLEDKPKIMFEQFLIDYNPVIPIDKNRARELVKTDELFKSLTVKWYQHLEKNNMSEAYSVYDDDYYFIDIFQCFKTYSRLFIRQLLKNPALEELKNIKSFVDVGCGLSYSTCALKQAYPDAKAYAVNLRDTKQWDFCQKMADTHDFTLVGAIEEINEPVDLVFASEFYEHLYEPLDHVKSVIDRLKPKYMVIANSFNVWAIGHFLNYKHGDRIIDQSKMGKIFNEYLRSQGYDNIKCGMWNNKPVIWKKK